MHRRLGVNVDHVATLRQVRRTVYPDPVEAAAAAERAGADQIVVHLREDRRHIQERDVRILRETVKTQLNLEMAATAEMMKIAFEVKPDICTIVPETREELTTEGGLDVGQNRDHLKKYIAQLRDADVLVALFIDPDIEAVKSAHRIDAPAIELHTGKYADARAESEQRSELRRIADAARTARKLGMRVAAGHGLHYHNTAALVPIDEIEEYNIGHSIVSRAVITGFEAAVRDMVEILRG